MLIWGSLMYKSLKDKMTEHSSAAVLEKLHHEFIQNWDTPLF